MPRAAVVIAAAGAGSRMGLGYNKVFAPVLGHPILYYSVRAFSLVECVHEVVVVVSEGCVTDCQAVVDAADERLKVTAVVPGGDSRQASVARGLEALKSHPSLVLIHDGARPCVRGTDISGVIAAGLADGAAALGTQCTDTLKRVDSAGFIEGTVDRESVWMVQTPQCFHYELLVDAMGEARRDGYQGTDECSVVERMGVRVRMVRGSHTNVKVTTPHDIYVVERILREGGQA